MNTAQTTAVEDRVLARLATGSMAIRNARTVAEMNALCNLTRKGLARWDAETKRYSITQQGDFLVSSWGARTDLAWNSAPGAR